MIGKALFLVRTSRKGALKSLGIDCPFTTKSEAKAARDHAIEQMGDGFFVTRGPDHMGKHGHSKRKSRCRSMRGTR